MKKRLLFTVLFAAVILLTASYTAWNLSDPDFTCAQCHEIRKSCASWRNSAHADIACTECHGTALSSISEKAGMVYKHIIKNKTHEDIFLNETQVLDIAGRCAECHQAEHAAWQSGAHSTSYRAIFMDVGHNRKEKPYWDCFRCHGMHYDGNIHDLMSLDGDVETWYIKDKEQADRPGITCLACHQMHNDQQQRRTAYRSLEDGSKAGLMQKTEQPATALYMRAEKRHLPSGMIYQTTIHHNGSPVRVSGDPDTWLCMQCHAPDSKREAGTEDDKTPLGLYEGMSCLDCHNPHSNGLKNDYRDVHKQLTKE